MHSMPIERQRGSMLNTILPEISHTLYKKTDNFSHISYKKSEECEILPFNSSTPKPAKILSNKSLSYKSIKPCPKCHDDRCIIKPSSSVHGAGIYCAHCDRWIAWMGKSSTSKFIDYSSDTKEFTLKTVQQSLFGGLN